MSRARNVLGIISPCLQHPGQLSPADVGQQSTAAEPEVLLARSKKWKSAQFYLFGVCLPAARIPKAPSGPTDGGQSGKIDIFIKK